MLDELGLGEELGTAVTTLSGTWVERWRNVCR